MFLSEVSRDGSTTDGVQGEYVSGVWGDLREQGGARKAPAGRAPRVAARSMTANSHPAPAPRPRDASAGKRIAGRSTSSTHPATFGARWERLVASAGVTPITLHGA